MEVLFVIVVLAFFWAGYWAGGKDARYKENEMRVKNGLTWRDGVEHGKNLAKQVDKTP